MCDLRQKIIDEAMAIYKSDEGMNFSEEELKDCLENLKSMSDTRLLRTYTIIVQNYL